MREVRDVFLCAGGRAQAGLARVAIDAPREISIVRGAVVRGESAAETGAMQQLVEASVQRVNPGKRWT